ncbi:unnamed protein product [Chrysoparadoxa australica]
MGIRFAFSLGLLFWPSCRGFSPPPAARASSSLHLFQGMKNIAQGITGGGTYDATLPSDAAPSWDVLQEKANATPFGTQQGILQAHWDEGAGPPHTDAKLRLFGRKAPEVTLYRDTAAWCPYCMKVVMMLELKEIPYKVEKINMRSYGEKPAWYLKKVPSGLLPALEFRGQLITESLVIMQTLDGAFAGARKMLPESSTPEWDFASRMMQQERNLFRWWCEFVFRPGDRARQPFEETLLEVDAALSSTPGPWLSGRDHPDLVDLTYIPHLERMCASTAYWKGYTIRGNPKFPAINRWFEALEVLPSYQAFRGDFYSHITNIPPQYGPGFTIDGAEEFQSTILGKDGSWDLPLPPLSESRTQGGKGSLEPVLEVNEVSDETARAEASVKLCKNHEAIVRFAARAVGKPSGWGLGPGRAELADPHAVPNETIIPDMDVTLRVVVDALLSGERDSAWVPKGLSKDNAEALIQCCEYLRDRVGVPRDMSYLAARQARAHLNWAIQTLKTT